MIEKHLVLDEEIHVRRTVTSKIKAVSMDLRKQRAVIERIKD